MKRIFIREKNEIGELKYQIIKLRKTIRNRFISFFAVVFLIYFFSFLYVISFNYVYHFTQYEWIKSSIFYFIIIELLILLICLLSVAIRKLSFKSKSEKLFKLSIMILIF